MAFDPDAYLASKPTKPAAGGFDPDAYLGTPPAMPTNVKPTKFVEPFPVRSQEEAWGDKPWTQKLVDLARGRSPMQTQKGIDEELGQKGGIGPGTQGYEAVQRVNQLKNTTGNMMAGGAAGSVLTKALLPLVTTFGGRVAAGTLGSAFGGGVGSGTQKAMEGGTPGEVVEAGKGGAAVGALVGLPLSTVGEGIGALAKGAPKRVAEADFSGLKEGVQYKTRIQKFEPNQDAMRAAMEQSPEIRAAIKQDARAALPMVEQKFKQVADQSLAPFYERMAASGQDQVPVEMVLNQLKAARGGFHDIAEASQVAVVDDLIEKFTKKAAETGGKLPAEYIRQAATSYQGQGYANLPMFGPVQLSKQLKQDVGNGLRAAVADHVESLAGNDASGKAVRQAFENANKEVALWYRIKDIVDEKARRISGNATPMGDLVSGANKVRHALKHPWETGMDLLPELPEAMDRAVLAPLARGADMFSSRTAGKAAQLSGAGNALVRAQREQQRQQEEMAARLRAGGR